MDTLIGLVTALGMAGLVIGPPLVLRRKFGANWKWFGIGIASWGLAVLVKFTLHGAFLALFPDCAPWGQGVWGGALSAVLELGAAALFLRPPMRAADVVAFGAGVGCFEILFKVGLGVAVAQEPGAPDLVPPQGAAFAVLGLAEHASSVVGHTATRVLVYLARAHRRALPAAIAFGTFALVDGLATYGWAAGWEWQALAVYVPVVAFLVGIATLEAWAALFLWRRLQRPGDGPATP